MCYLRQVKLDPQNRIYSNEALSGEKPRVLGTLVDPPLVADPPLVVDSTLVVDPSLDARRRCHLQPGRKPVGDI